MTGYPRAPAEHEGNEYVVAIQLAGSYLNRPPVAALAFQGDGIELGPDGCPRTRDADPDIVVANTPDGLVATLHSDSHDPDGVWPGDQGPKLKRLDLAFEQWARNRDGAFGFVGAGRDVGPVLFESGQEHQLLLWVNDRRGAEARKVCRFEVIPR